MMKSRRSTSVLLFLFGTCSGLAVDVPQREGLDPVKAAVPRAPAPPAIPPSVAPRVVSGRPDVGTKDAPVDGLDGKPHAGPFVDLTADSDKTGVSKELAGAKAILDTKMAEDSVMNDPNRANPRKGTTGTEGGMTEREKDKKAFETEMGAKRINKPDPPKEPPPRAHDEETVRKEFRASKSAQNEKGTKNTIEDVRKRKGAPGMVRPDDLPDKTHDHALPVPAPQALKNKLNLNSYEDFGGENNERPSQAEGAHDLIKWDSLAGSFSSIAATEIGDKTFIVAALMAMRHARLQVFSAAFTALFIMTVLSAFTGHAVGSLISKRWAAIVAALLFLGFGAKSLKEGYDMRPDQGVSEEIREVQAELEEKEVDIARAQGKRRTTTISPYALEAGRLNGARRSRSQSRLPAPRRSPSSSSSRSPSRSRLTVASTLASIKNLFSLLLSPAWVETFSMTFIGELGDRSQIATVAMAAGQEYFWVMVGATLGHFVCTAVAVIGGSVLAGRVSMRKVTLIGGAIFIGFGLYTSLEAYHYWF